MRIERTLAGLLFLAWLATTVPAVIAAEEEEVKVKLGDCSAAVQSTFKREANGATISEVIKEVEDGKTTFEADVKIDGKNYEIKIAEDGTLLEKVLDVDEDEEEVEIKLSDCPAAVQATLKREANGASIDKVDKKTDDGKTIYEVDVKIDGKNYEINVAADGTLISKSLDEDEENEDKDK